MVDKRESAPLKKLNDTSEFRTLDISWLPERNYGVIPAAAALYASVQVVTNKKEYISASLRGGYINDIRESTHAIWKNLVIADGVMFEQEPEKRLAALQTTIDSCHILEALLLQSRNLPQANIPNKELLRIGALIELVRRKTIKWRKGEYARAKTLIEKKERIEWTKLQRVVERGVFNAMSKLNQT